MNPSSRPTLSISPQLATAVIVLRPWLVLGLLLGLVLSFVDGSGWWFGVGGGMTFGVIDLLWTVVFLGRRRIEVDDDHFRVMWGTFTICEVPRGRVTGIEVVVSSGGWLSYLIPAYHPLATVSLLGTHVRFDFLLRTSRQTSELEHRLQSYMQLSR